MKNTRLTSMTCLWDGVGLQIPETNHEVAVATSKQIVTVFKSLMFLSHPQQSKTYSNQQGQHINN